MSDDVRSARRLSGKVAVVTGASSGSGRAVAKRFAAEGADVIMLARGPERLRELEAELGPVAKGIATDVGDPASVRAAFVEIADRFGRLDILVNNAAILQPWPFELLEDDRIQAQVHTNLLGPIYTSRSAIPLMRAAGGGDIINTSSEVTIEHFSFLSIYSATKCGLEGLSQALRTELEQDDIRVTTLVQGTARGEGGGSQGWEYVSNEHADEGLRRLNLHGVLRRTVGLHGGMAVEDVAEAHVFVVTRPRAQKLDLVRVRSY